MNDNIHPIFDRLVTRDSKEALLEQRSKVLWFTGLSGSGKSTIVSALEIKLLEQGHFSQVLDGDNIRAGICNNLDFSMEGRTENIRRISEVSKLFCQSGIICLNSFVSPTIAIRSMAKEIIGKKDFIEVYVDASLEVCEERDVKGLYKKARAGEIKGFTGIDSVYEVPEDPDIHLNTSQQSVEDSVRQVLDYLGKYISR